MIMHLRSVADFPSTKKFVLTEAACSSRLPPSSHRRWRDFWPRTRSSSRETSRTQARGSGKYNVVSATREVSEASGCHRTRPEIVAELYAGAVCERCASLRTAFSPRPHCLPIIIGVMHFLATDETELLHGLIIYYEFVIYNQVRVSRERERKSSIFSLIKLLKLIRPLLSM